jgi:translocation and assembly module TamB
MHVNGSLGDPHWDGRLVVGGGEIKLNSDLPALANVKGSLHLSDEGVRLAGVTAELGGAPIQVGGSVTFPEDGGPVGLALTLKGERLLLARDPEVLMRADADLKLDGTWEKPALSGSLALRRSWLNKRITLLDLQPGSQPVRERGVPLFSIREPPFRDMTLALSVTSVEPIILRGNVARGGFRPDLRITGTGEVPKLEGTVYLEPTTVSLPGTPVEFRGGTLTFDPRNPFVPSLSLVGTAEKFGHDITAVVTGPYDDPEVELTSTPPLTQEEIVLILLAGRPPTGDQGGGAIEATQNIAIYLASDFASSWLGGGESTGESWLERVEVVSGREISQNGVPTLEVRLRVSEDFPIDGSRVYLSYEDDVYEDQNLGVRFAFRLR